MKFSQSIKFNAVPEWSSKYLDYGALKKVIYSLQKQELSASGHDEEHQSLLGPDYYDELFAKSLDVELAKIDSFYTEQETKIYRDLSRLEAEFLGLGSSLDDSTSDSDASDDEMSRSSPDISRRRSISPTAQRRLQPSLSSSGHQQSSRKRDARIKEHLKQRCISLFVSLSELNSYAQLNKTGFSKALKKYDKTLRSNFKDKYMNTVLAKAHAFSKETESDLSSKIDDSARLYAAVTHNNDLKNAYAELRLHLREHVAWSRNTVWKDMINLEQSARVDGLDEPSKPASEEKKFYGIKISQLYTLLKSSIILLIFIGFLVFPAFPSSVEQSHCLALVVLASLLWATETMPLFVTSLMIPLMVVVLRIPRNQIESDDGQTKFVRMTAEESSKFIFSQMWSSVITLLLGGFTLAAVLSKYNIARLMATTVLSKSGTSPRVVLLVIMFLATFLSMWISNVAAPVLCYSIIQPLLRPLPTGSPFGKALILGVALASNIGGMVSPIASPQNIIALENMNPAASWLQWFVVSIPVAIIGLLLIWGFLLMTFSVDKAILPTVRKLEDKFTSTQAFICFVSAGSILLWCFSSSLEPYVGEMGVLALIPIIVFFGTGLLTQSDFNNFMWTIIALAMGGNALGKAVLSSGLLATVASMIEAKVDGLPLFQVMLVFGLMVLVVATFISHTVAALIILPLIASVGERMADPHPNLLVMGCALLCSAAMGLPTSGFPNVTAICMVDEVGRPYLTVKTFITRGVPSSVFVYAAVISVGYLTMRVINL